MNARLTACLLAGALALAAPPGMAQQPDESTRTAARALGTAGVEAYQANDFATATDKLEKAYALLRVPSLGLWSGRALVKAGKWVEAADRFLEATSLQVPAGEYAVQKQAQADAAAELAALRPKIPVLVVKTEGAELADATVNIDGVPVASSLLATGRLVNPGTHVVEGRHGAEQARAELSVGEGEQATAVLRFAAPAAAAAPSAPAPGVSLAAPAPAPAQPETPAASPAQRTWGFVALAAGGAGLVMGGVTGAVALGKKGDLDDDPGCRNNRCAPSLSDKVNSYNSLRTVSSIGFFAGGGLAAVGLVLVLTAPSERRTEAFVGPGSAGLRGRF